jgi:hypothetical protein
MKSFEIILLVSALLFVLVSMEPARMEKKYFANELRRLYLTKEDIMSPDSDSNKLDEVKSWATNHFDSNKKSRTFKSLIDSLINEYETYKESGDRIVNPFFRF